MQEKKMNMLLSGVGLDNMSQAGQVSWTGPVSQAASVSEITFSPVLHDGSQPG